MRTELLSANAMQPYPEHPSEEALERFILHRMEDEELEGVETHILACHQCVTRLEELEIQIAATKMALADLHQQTVAENYSAHTAGRKHKSWWASFTLGRTLSLAGAVAAVALTVTIAPRYTPVERDLSAFRGAETNTVPAGRPVLLHLNARDLSESTVSLEVVNAEGNQIWNGAETVSNDTVNAKLPPIDTKGNYLLRIYSKAHNQSRGELLREFAFDVQ